MATNLIITTNDVQYKPDQGTTATNDILFVSPSFVLYGEPTSTTSAAELAVVQPLSGIFMHDSGFDFIEAIFCFQLRGPLLTSAPTQQAGDFTAENLFTVFVSVGTSTTPPTDKYIVDAQIQSKGTTSQSSTYKSVPTTITGGATNTYYITFPVTNFFNVSQPGAPYTLYITLSKITGQIDQYMATSLNTNPFLLTSCFPVVTPPEGQLTSSLEYLAPYIPNLPESEITNYMLCFNTYQFRLGALENSIPFLQSDATPPTVSACALAQGTYLCSTQQQSQTNLITYLVAAAPLKATLSTSVRNAPTLSWSYFSTSQSSDTVPVNATEINLQQTVSGSNFTYTYTSETKTGTFILTNNVLTAFLFVFGDSLPETFTLLITTSLDPLPIYLSNSQVDSYTTDGQIFFFAQAANTTSLEYSYQNSTWLQGSSTGRPLRLQYNNCASIVGTTISLQQSTSGAGYNYTYFGDSAQNGILSVTGSSPPFFTVFDRVPSTFRLRISYSSTNADSKPLSIYLSPTSSTAGQILYFSSQNANSSTDYTFSNGTWSPGTPKTASPSPTYITPSPQKPPDSQTTFEYDAKTGNYQANLSEPISGFVFPQIRTKKDQEEVKNFVNHNLLTIYAKFSANPILLTLYVSTGVSPIPIPYNTSIASSDIGVYFVIVYILRPKDIGADARNDVTWDSNNLSYLYSVTGVTFTHNVDLKQAIEKDRQNYPDYQCAGVLAFRNESSSTSWTDDVYATTFLGYDSYQNNLLQGVQCTSP